MAGQWAQRLEFWNAMPRASHALFLAGVFVLFLPAGLVGDISHLGSDSPSRLLLNMLFSGATAAGYVLAARRPRWIPLVVAVQLLVTVQFDRIAGSRGAPLSGQALQTRLDHDATAIQLLIIVSFVLLTRFVRTEGARYARAHTEIALARDIHRMLVPRIERQIGGFVFRGVSLPSGEVGGDLIDLVESGNGWMGYVADVSGHGVAAGLLMGMVKSAARTELRMHESIDRFLNDLNAVLVDLKRPEMFVTFAGLRFDGTSELQFSVAGHLPILHCHAADESLDEVSIAQLPLAMFGETSFFAARVACAPGDLFVILTDGLTEVFDRQDREFGLDRVKALVREHANAPLARLEEHLLAAVRAHGPQLDDQTVLLVRRLS